MMTPKKEIPLIFAVDDIYAPYMSVTLTSIFANASKNYFYSVYVLEAGLSEEVKNKLLVFNSENVKLEFVNVTEQLDAISEKLYLRDYYTNTTYYRFFIPALFPQYDKALYLDSDLIVLDDISKLFNNDISDYLLGAIQEEVMALVKVFGDYVEQGLDVPCNQYFNAGISLFNLKKFREYNVEGKFIELLGKFKFEVTQDQDYLNVICKDKVAYFDLGWNKTPIENKGFDDKNLKIIHYKLSFKPWHYDDVMYGDYFWKYAKMSNFYDKILQAKNNYSDAEKENDKIAYERLQKLAYDYTHSQNTYKLLK